MDIDSPNAKGKNKRPADTIAPAPPDPSDATTTPRILRRHHHRRRNVAASVWGPDIPPTPAPTPHGTSSTLPRFNIYRAILRHQNLFFQFAVRLPYPTILSLYAIDKEFHYRLNKYSVSLMHDYARYHAPDAGYIFSWVLYPELCISDPMLRPMDGRRWLARDAPGFRWVGMVLWRDSVVREILTLLAVEGLRVPASTMATLMKFWLLMEMNTTVLRQAFLTNSDVWSDADIINMQLLLVKLDMRITGPVLGNGICGFSHMLLTQKSLGTLWKVLTGSLKMDYDMTTDMLVRTYLTEDMDLELHPWLDDEMDNGVPEEQWGLMYRESWHMDGKRMESPVDMVVTEGIRRGLHVQQYYLDFVLYGHTDLKTGGNLPAPRQWRKDGGVVVPKEAWPDKHTREKMIATLDERFGTRSNPEGEMMDTST